MDRAVTGLLAGGLMVVSALVGACRGREGTVPATSDDRAERAELERFAVDRGYEEDPASFATLVLEQCNRPAEDAIRRFSSGVVYLRHRTAS